MIDALDECDEDATVTLAKLIRDEISDILGLLTTTLLKKFLFYSYFEYPAFGWWGSSRL